MSLERETQECMRVIGVGELPLEWADAVWEHNNCEDRSSLDIVHPTVP